jgi:hypothetical protein
VRLHRMVVAVVRRADVRVVEVRDAILGGSHPARAAAGQRPLRGLQGLAAAGSLCLGAPLGHAGAVSAKCLSFETFLELLRVNSCESFLHYYCTQSRDYADCSHFEVVRMHDCLRIGLFPIMCTGTRV